MSELVLVTGANGFIGRAVCRRLIELGYIPRAGVRDIKPWPALQAAVPKLSELAILGDLNATPNLHAALAGVSAVVHLAARVHVMHDGAANPLEEYRRANVEGTRAVALAAVEHGVRRMVFVSTVKVNGESTCGKGFSESDPPDPQGPYAVSKWEAEEMLQSIAAKTGLEVVIVRPPLVYGPGVKANFLRLMRLARLGLPLPLPNTNNRRSLVGVDNLADCLVRCATHSKAANHTFMVSDGQDVSTRELIVQLAHCLGRPARFMPIPEVALRLAVQMAGKRPVLDRLLGSLEIDSGAVRRTLEWKPPVTLSNGLEATARWYLESLRKLS